MELTATTLRMIADLRGRLEAAESRAAVAEAKLQAMQSIEQMQAALIEAVSRIEMGDMDCAPILSAINNQTQTILAALATKAGPGKIVFDLHRDGADVVRKITANISH